jgi:phytoene synthase
MALVRRHDRDRFQTALFAPPRQREALFALYAFNYEIARVRETVTEPMLGQIRLQWWREVIAAAFTGEPPRQHEVAAPLTAAIRDLRLSREHFDRLIDSRERDLDPEAPANMAKLESYAEGTSGTLVLLALEVFGEQQLMVREAGRALGIGYALTGLLRAMPFHATAGRCYIPTDLAARSGLDIRDYQARRTSAALRAAAAEIAAVAQQQLSSARANRGAIPRAAIVAMLPAVIADRFLGRLVRTGYDPFDRRLAVPDTLQSWRLAAAALFHRY